VRPRGENLDYDALRDKYQTQTLWIRNLQECIDVMTRRIAELEDQNRLLHAALDGAYL
jgi:hypothetical protein